MSTGLDRPTRTGATIGAKDLTIAIFSFWPSGMTRRTESTSDTVGSFSKASCFRRSSSRLVAEASPLNPERPVVAKMRFSHATDSVPFACKLSRL